VKPNDRLLHCLSWLELAGRPPPDYISAMCGRIIRSGGPLRYAIVDGAAIVEPIELAPDAA
jgi:hypothetical protein